VNATFLRIYLNDHLAGSTAGLELGRRAAAENRNTPLGEHLRALVSELEEERAVLEGVMSALGVRRDLIKDGLAWLAEKVGRLKLNGRLIGYSALSRLEELEALGMAVEAQLSLWRTLRRLSRREERLGRFDFSTLIARAEQQRRSLERLRLQGVEEIFSDRGGVVRLGPTPAERVPV
jgi:hypothetical protein